MIITCLPTRLLILAILGALLGCLLLFTGGMPTFLGNNVPEEANAGGLQTLWFLVLGFIFVSLYLAFRDTSAVSYYRGLNKAVENRLLMRGQLRPEEQPLINRSEARHVEHRALSKKRVFLTLLITTLLWFPTFTTLYAQQFLNYLGAWGWINYPMVWVPMIAYGPG